MIFHCGRCGSTLLGRMFAVDPGNRVCLEPRELRQFIRRERANFGEPKVRAAFRLLVLSLGAHPTGAERRMVVKLNSTAITLAGEIAQSLPATPLIYLLRDPTEVVASLLSWAPDFLDENNRETLAGIMGGLERPVQDYSPVEWLAWYVGRNLQWAWDNRDHFAAVIDYRDQATHFPRLVRRIAGTVVPEGDPRMVQARAMHAKYPDQAFSRAQDLQRVVHGLERTVAPLAGGIYKLWRERLDAVVRPDSLPSTT